MSEIDFRFFGWNNEGTSDKIWGWFKIGDKVYNFWGPRGEKKLVKLNFKQFESHNSREHSMAYAKEQEKRRKGYVSIPLTIEDDSFVEIEKIYPGFSAHLKKQLLITKLSGFKKRGRNSDADA